MRIQVHVPVEQNRTEQNRTELDLFKPSEF